MPTKHSGALALTWTNKERRLLSHEDGTYEWVDPTDFRVSEVRLLHSVKSVGDVHPDRQRAEDNLLIRGDSLHALTSLLRIPEFAIEYEGKVKLVYIDPPFNTGQAFTHYDDGLEHSVWLTMLRDRLVQIKKLLRPDGTVWVHLDDAEAHRARLVLDEVFGTENFVATVIWEKTTSARNDTKWFSTDQDYIHVYAKDKTHFRPNKMAHADGSESAYRNPDNDVRGPWREVDYKAMRHGDGGSLVYPITRPADGLQIFPTANRTWAYSKTTHEKNVEDGRLWWGKQGLSSFPKFKKFLYERSDGVPPSTLWKADEVDTSRRAKDQVKKLFPGQNPFETPKPERLMERILNIASETGDIVLDCFAGSGTTAAVANKMCRRWVTCEWSAANITSFTLPRLEKVVAGEDLGGITKSCSWQGGGGFRLLDVASSVYEVQDSTILLSEKVTAGELAESVAAQLGFAYEPDGVFVGAKGRMRLVVIDGVLNDDIIRILVSALKDKERVTVVATAAEPGAEDLLHNLSAGSKVRKVPRDLARLSKRRSEVVQLMLGEHGDSE